METAQDTPLLPSNGTEPALLPPPVPEAPDPLDAILAQNTEQLEHLRYWRWLALAAVGVALGALGFAHIGWFLRPDVVPMVQHVYVDAQGSATSVGPPVPMAQYTPQDWQWVTLLRDYVLRLRMRGLDERQMILAWEWLQWHSCGPAVDFLKRYHELEKPFERIGAKTRDITNIQVTKGDIPQVYTVMWTEVFTQMPQPPVTTQQSVSFGVARRDVKKDGLAYNPFGLCIRVIGGLNR